MKKLIYIFLFFIICHPVLVEGQVSKVDSLKQLLKTAKHDTIKLRILFEMVEEEVDDKIWPLFNEQLKSTAEKILSSKPKVLIANIAKKYLADALNNKGFFCNNQGDIPNALESYDESLKIYEDIGYKKGIAVSLNNIGFIYENQGDISKALEYYKKSLKIREEIVDKIGTANSLNNIGFIYEKQGNIPKALEYYNKGLKIKEEIGDKDGIATFLNNMGVIFKKSGDLSKALEYYTKSLKIREEIGDKRGMTYSLNNIGNIYIKQNKIKESKIYFEKSYQISKELGYPEYIKNGASRLTIVYEKLGKFQLAYQYYKEEIGMRDSLQNEENYKASVEQHAKYEYAKKAATDSIANAKEKEIKDAEIAQQQAQIKVKRFQQYGLIGGLVLVILFAGFVFNRLKVTQRQNVIIEAQKQEVEEQKKVVEEKHKEITDSINYAERIQRSFLATTEMLDEYLNAKHVVESCHPESVEGTAKQSHSNEQIASLPTVVRNDESNYFVFFRPKDVVSGDFYWAAELNNGNFAFSCADSTGHGVPGAIMSILNISSLEKSIEKETAPDQILNQTRKIIIERLKKDGSPEGGKDGMDCSLLVLNKDKSQLTFAASNNPVFILRPIVIAREAKQSVQSCHSEPVEESMLRQAQHDKNDMRNDGSFELLEFKPDKMPVGKHDKDHENFTLQTVQLQKGDIIYSLTDGFTDQFGGNKGKKYMIKNFKEFLLQIAPLKMCEQEQKLSDEFDAWKGKNDQVDDVCIIGVRI
ncbi:MAG: hypothetical protein A3K10_16890 [Bacteroidetes bacterium RIFCSPLOWO2_12_FULL_31_6]|nr:MAG: hypothetical protein A3K10_16890 [Bacteroidetes bacterium RIFCSPLOWO2_12_FULL_31_6]